MLRGGETEAGAFAFCSRRGGEGDPSMLHSALSLSERYLMTFVDLGPPFLEAPSHHSTACHDQINRQPDVHKSSVKSDCPPH